MTTAHPRRNWLRHGAAAIVVLALMLGAHQAQAEIRMHFLDVGQGDATLVQTSDGCTLLIDAGRHDREDMRGHLERHGVEHIDLLVGTHPHADHIGQFDTVLRGWPVGEVWMSGWEHDTRTFERALDAILDSEAAYEEPRAGERVACGALEIDVIHPVEPITDIHDNIALRIGYGDFAAIVPGDVEEIHEAEMLDRSEPLEADILRLGHHGSHTSTTPAFLEAVDPVVAIYSAGADNRYGHPHDVVLDLVSAAGIDLYGTMTHGTISVRSDGTQWEIDYTGTQDAGADGCIDINSAPAASLTRIIQIGDARAGDIKDLSAAEPLTALDELEQIHGVGPATVREIRDQGLACVE